jgi:hypothetical protein
METLLKVTDAVKSLKVCPYFANQRAAYLNKGIAGDQIIWLAACD